MKSVSRPKFKRVISVEELKSKRTPRTAKRKPEKKQSKRANVFSSLGKRSDISLADVMSLAKLHQSQQVGYECKTVSVEGKIDVSVLYADYGTVWKYLPSPVSSSVQSVVMNLFKGRQYRFNLSTCFNMSSSGTGIINSAINVAALASNPSFTALSGVFSEFFVTRMDVHWQPVSRYNGPIGTAIATTASSLPIGLASLQHGIAAYTSLSNMTENQHYAYSNTSDPFSYSWINVESPSSTVLTNSSGVSQGWELTGNASSYSGTIQILSQPAPPGLPPSAVLGTFTTFYDVLFRVRE